MYYFPNSLTQPWAFLPMGSCVPFSLGHPWPICLPWASSTLLLTFYSHRLLLTSLDFPSPITSYSSLGFIGLPLIPYSLCLHCFGPAAAHSYFFHITHCSWVCYSLFLSFRALLSPFAFSRPIFLFHGPVIHYSYRLGLIVFCSLSLANFLVLLSWASFLTFGFHKKGPSTIIFSLNSRLYNSINIRNYNKCLLITTIIMKFHIYVKEKKKS